MMDKMLNYIFGSLGRSEDAIEKLNRKFGKQTSINGWMFTLYIWGVIYTHGIDLKSKAQKAKIKELEERLAILESENKKG